MPSGEDGTDPGEEFALLIQQFDPVPESADELSDILTVIEVRREEWSGCILQFGALEQNACIGQLVIEATMIHVQMGMDHVANIPRFKLVPSKLGLQGLLSGAAGSNPGEGHEVLHTAKAGIDQDGLLSPSD